MIGVLLMNLMFGLQIHLVNKLKFIENILLFSMCKGLQIPHYKILYKTVEFVHIPFYKQLTALHPFQ